MTNINDENIVDHYKRMRQRFLQYGIKWWFSGQDEHCAYQVYENEEGLEYMSAYVFKEHRGKGLYKDFVSKVDFVITLPECNLENYLKKNSIPYYIPKSIWDREYALIEEFYRGKSAKRSGIPYINHIDEGLGVLHKLKASDLTKRAFCMHPIYQGEESNMIASYEDNFAMVEVGSTADYYSQIANSLLRSNYKENRSKCLQSEILSDSVLRDMLIADKIQNFKDFKRVGSRKINTPIYKDKEEIENYFLWWLDFLEVDRIMERELTEYITDTTF